MKKLELKKESVISLSDSQLANVNGGGYRRSERLDGGCRYSRSHATVVFCDCSSEPITVGCYPSPNG